MDSKPPQNPPRKFKFQPKAPPRRAPVPIPAVKEEKVEDVDSVQAKNLLKQFQERSMRGKLKVEKKEVQCTFGLGSASTKLRSFGVSIGRNTSNRNGSASNGGAHSSALRDKEYREPWDYYSYYPVVLPLRRPYAGNPAILDEEEFGQDSETVNSLESSMNPARDLCLLVEILPSLPKTLKQSQCCSFLTPHEVCLQEENEEPTMLFMQLPSTYPMIKRSVTTEDHETKESSRPQEEKISAGNLFKSRDLPGCKMGKTIVHRSGAVKLKLGNTLFDVSPGMDCIFAEDVSVLVMGEMNCSVVVAEIEKHVTVTPDVDALINGMSDLGL